jgi:AAA+ superfamily predicted ATPase
MSGADEPRFDELLGVLERLDRILARAVHRLVQTVGDQAAADPFRGLYTSVHDATRMATDSRWSPLLGVADNEPPLTSVLDPDSRLVALAADHGLSSFDIDVLAITLAPEVDLGYGRLYAFLQDDVSRRRPSVDLALNLLCPTIEAKMARREHFAADAPLISADLVQLVTDPAGPPGPLLARVLDVDDAVVRHLLGVGGPDPELRHDCTLVEPAADHGPAPGTEVARIGPLVAEAHVRSTLRLYFSGPAVSDKRRAARWLAGQAGAPLLAVALGGLAATTDDVRTVARRLLREARLQGALVLAEELDALDEAGTRGLWDALAGHRGVVVLAGPNERPPRGDGQGGLLRVAFPIPGHAERRSCWEAALRADGMTIAEQDVEILAGRFRLTPDDIADAALTAGHAARLRGLGTQPTIGDLFAAARDRSDAALAGVARKVRPINHWGQLALPDETVALLREMCQQIIERHQVLDAWGFGQRLSLGKGVSALFAGPSGTGKTTAADIIALELGLDLYKIDLSGVVSKYIGETEKNLERIFTAAENANAILFFDEADALFGKRSEVRDAHDRYANIEIAYLLQRMEQYEGVAILATNLRQNMDEAFVRRLQFVVEFPFPDEAQRARIWPLLFPDEAERDVDIDFGLLARQFRITGGTIKNIVLSAAFLAAGDHEPIGTGHLVQALQREYQKMGKVLSEAELEPYRELVAR